MNALQNLSYAWGVVEKMLAADYPRQTIRDYMAATWKWFDLPHEKFCEKSNNFLKKLPP